MKKFIPTCFESLGRQWFVAQNNPKASDENEGTEKSPLKTISRAAELMGRFDEVVIDEGIYREEIPLKVNGHCYTPEWRPVFKAVPNAKVYVRGSDVFECEWKKLENDAFSGALPETLFESGIYNPFELGFGRVFVDDEEILDGWKMSEDGKSLIVNFNPQGKLIEISTRKRCFQPQFKGIVYMAVFGIRVEHAAEPGPFCVDRGETIKENPVSDITIRKTFNIPGTTTRTCRLFTGEVGYISTKNDLLKAIIYDDTIPDDNTYIYDATSDDHGKTWKRVSDNRLATDSFSEDLFLDEDTGLLIKTTMDFFDGADPREGCAGDNINRYQGVSAFSLDEGKTWSSTQKLGLNLVPFRVHKLNNGEYILPCGKTRHEGRGFHQDIVVYRSVHKDSGEFVCWEKIAGISVSPDESGCGLAEPHITSFADGKLIMLLRMGAILPSQNRDGVPSVKFYSVSDDNGSTWTKPAALLYEDGAMIYSPRSYQDIFRSSKNGKVYAIFNICDEPTIGCDPRTHLQIMEVDPETVRVKRDSVTLIEAKHPEHDNRIRYSNWVMFESRETRNPVLLMRTQMCQLCSVRYGYDLSSYRYEIELPE